MARRKHLLLSPVLLNMTLPHLEIDVKTVEDCQPGKLQNLASQNHLLCGPQTSRHPPGLPRLYCQNHRRPPFPLRLRYG